jgi:uncharacterized membrane protein (DUF2068 family)
MHSKRVRRVPRSNFYGYAERMKEDAGWPFGSTFQEWCASIGNYARSLWDGDGTSYLPTGIKILALLNFAGAVLNIILTVVSILSLRDVATTTLIPNDVSSDIQSVPLLSAVLDVSRTNQDYQQFLRTQLTVYAIAGLVGSALAFVLGLGLLKLRPWARWLGIISYGLSVLITIAQHYSTALTGATLISLAIGVAAVVYLLTPQVTTSFESS